MPVRHRDERPASRRRCARLRRVAQAVRLPARRRVPPHRHARRDAKPVLDAFVRSSHPTTASRSVPRPPAHHRRTARSRPRGACRAAAHRGHPTDHDERHVAVDQRAQQPAKSVTCPWSSGVSSGARPRRRTPGSSSRCAARRQLQVLAQQRPVDVLLVRFDHGAGSSETLMSSEGDSLMRVARRVPAAADAYDRSWIVLPRARGQHPRSPSRGRLRMARSRWWATWIARYCAGRLSRARRPSSRRCRTASRRCAPDLAQRGELRGPRCRCPTRVQRFRWIGSEVATRCTSRARPPPLHSDPYPSRTSAPSPAPARPPADRVARASSAR